LDIDDQYTRINLEINLIKSPWSEYFKTTIEKEPNETVVFAEKLFRNSISRCALDIGSGTGCDSLYLLEHGFEVKALDSDINAIAILKKKIKNRYRNKVTFENALIQNYGIGNSSYDLINASFSLPFCNKIDFQNVWINIFKGLKTNGIFSGQLFGVNDDWSGIKDMSFVTNEELDDLISGYKPEYYIEIDEDGRIADGSVKHWHLFNIVLRKL
jgi:SAM-dependent methyltransferase